MGLLNRVEHEALKRLKPWLAPEHDAAIKLILSSSQLLLQVRNINLNIAALNASAMATSTLVFHEVVVEEATLKLALFRSPVVTLTVRGLHIVLKPRSASDPQWTSKKQSSKDHEGVAQDSAGPKVAVKQGKSAAVTSFLINSIASFALSSIRLELHDCSIKLVSLSLKPWSYACSVSLESAILEEGSLGDAGMEGGLFHATLRAVRGHWDQKAGTVKKLCIFRCLALNLETLTKNPAVCGRNSTPNKIKLDSETFLEKSRSVERCNGAPSTNSKVENETRSLNGYCCTKRDQILLLESVSVAVKMQEIEFFGLVVEVPEVLAGLDAKELDILLVLVAQVNGAGVLETDKTLDMTLSKASRVQPELTRHGLLRNDFNTEVHSEVGKLEEIYDIGDETSGAKFIAGTLPESVSTVQEPKLVRISLHDLFRIWGWRLWVHSFSEVVGFAGQAILVILLLLKSVPALARDAWNKDISSSAPLQLDMGNTRDSSADTEQHLASISLENHESEKVLFKVVKNRGPTFEVYFGRGLFTLACSANFDAPEKKVETSQVGTELEVRGIIQPGVHMMVERVSLEYGLDHIGSGGRFGLGGWQLDLISILHSQSPHKNVLTLQQGRWPKKTSDILQLFRSQPYEERSKKHKRFVEFQDIEEVPRAAQALKKHVLWQDNAAKSWSRHVWKIADESQLHHADISKTTTEGRASRAFLIAEFGTADVADGAEVPGGLMTCALSMGCLECFSDSTISYRLRPLLDQLLTTKTPTGNVDKSDPVPIDAQKSDVSYEEVMLKYINICRHFVGLAVPTDHVELSVVIESSKFHFTATMGQFEESEEAKVAVSDNIPVSSRGSSLVVEIGSLQLLTWPAARKEVLSEMEARVPMKDAPPIGWWDECVDDKLWLKKPPSPTFPSDALGLEEAQVANNFYFALEDAGVMLQRDRGSQVIVPVVGPISCVIQSSFCRDDLHSHWGEIKSSAVSLEGKLAPVTLLLYLEELAIFSEIAAFGNALIEGFTPPKIVDEGEMDNSETSPDFSRESGRGQNLKDPTRTEVVADRPPNILFVLLLKVQLEAFQIILSDRRHSESKKISERKNSIPGSTSSLTGHTGSRIEGVGHVGFGGIHSLSQGRTCYFATLPALLDISVGDGYETQISLEMSGAHMGIVANHVHKSKQQELLDQSFVDSTALDFEKLLQIAETGFAFDRSAINLHGPKLVGEVGTHPSGELDQADGETQLDFSLTSIDGTTPSSGEGLASSAARLPSSQISTQGPHDHHLLPNDTNSDIVVTGSQQIDDRHWLVVMVDIGSISVTDSLGEALVDKVMLLASGDSALHVRLELGKDGTLTMDAEGGLVIIQTTALHSLVDFINVYVDMLRDVVSGPQPSNHEQRDVIALQRLSNADGPSPLLKTTARSVSLPPWALTRNSAKMRRMMSAPRRLQASAELLPEIKPKKGYDGCVGADFCGLSLVLVQRGSTRVPVEGFLIEVDAKGKAQVRHGNMIGTSIGVTRASILGLQGRTFGGIGTRNSTRTPQFRHNFSGSGSGDFGQATHKSHHSHPSLTTSSSGLSDDIQDEQEADESSSLNDGSWKPLDESSSYVLEQLSFKFAMEKVLSNEHPDFWKWRNSWKGSCSVVGFDFAITTSEVQLLLSVMAPLSGLSGSSSSMEPQLKEYTRSKSVEFDTEAPDAESYLPDGAVIAIKDMTEHYYLAVEEKSTNSDGYRLVGVLHYSLVGDRALFKVKYQRNKNGKTVWFSLLSLHAKDKNGEPYRVHYLPGSGLAEVATIHDNSWELWQCIESTEPKSEGSEELGVHISHHTFHLVNQKSKCGLALVEGSPMLVKRPGNPFKVRILAQQHDPDNVKLVSLENAVTEDVEHDQKHEHDQDCDQQLREKAVSATIIPNVTCDIQDFTFTLLHEASGGMHLLPLLRLCMQDIGAVLQIGSGKTRVLFGCSVALDYFQAENSCWVAVINPIGIELVYRARSEQPVGEIVSKKTPIAIFCRLRKVDIIISELSLDTLLFLIGALDLAGPYTLRHSPVLANRCEVENQTGLDLVCRFDHGKAKQDGVVQSRETDAFLIRHTTSRRDLTSAEVASSVDLYLQKEGGGRSSVVQVSLTEPGGVAVRTRLQISGEGRRNFAPGPILVVDVMRQIQGGISLTVSPMVRIRNATGLFLELQCRRPNQEGEGAVVLLEDGDIIDDSVGSFDALRLEGERRKALTSFNVGNYLLSMRPASNPGSMTETRAEDTSSESSYGWSEDVKGAKAVKVSNLFEKFQFSFKKKLGGRNPDVSFGTVFCPAKRPEKEEQGLHFLIRTTRRQVAVTRSDKELVHGKAPLASWQEQQELLLLPTIRIFNLFTSNISAKLFALAPGRARGKAGSLSQPKNEVSIGAGKTALMYADLGNLSLVIRHQQSGLTSKQVPIFGREKNTPDASIEGGGLREMELEVDFADGAHYGMLNVHQDDDGVLECVSVLGISSAQGPILFEAIHLCKETLGVSPRVCYVVVYTKYVLHNDSHVPLLYCAPKQRSSYLWRRGKSNDANLEWPGEETVSTLQPGLRISWYNRSNKVMMKQVSPEAQPSILDLDLLAGSTEISLKASLENADQRVQLGVELQLPAVGDTNPTRTVHLAPRYIVLNKSADAICVCQDGFQDDSSAVMVLNPGEKTALHCRLSREESNENTKSDTGQNPLQVPLTVRFKPRGSEWDWSGPVCAAALGSFWIKIRHRGQSGHYKHAKEPHLHKAAKGRLLFALAEVQEDSPSLTMTFRKHIADAIPYRIENDLQSGTLLYNQKGLSQTEALEAGSSVNYVWDDLGLTHKLEVSIQGTQLRHVINMDKIREWKRFGAARRNKGFSLQLPFLEESKDSDNEDEGHSTGAKFMNVGYEVVADGPTRVLRICSDSDSNRKSGWQSNMRKPQTEVEVKVPLLFFSIVEPRKQSILVGGHIASRLVTFLALNLYPEDYYESDDRLETAKEKMERGDTASDEKEAEDQSMEKRVIYAPIIVARVTNLLTEALVTEECTLCQLKVERLDVDVKWQGATLAHMVRVHGQDTDKLGQTVLHMACVVAHRGSNPIQIHYASLLLQAVDLNIDEDTLMKLAPFYRTSLALSTGPSRLIYYERFEIHPIKIMASFTPGSPRADYTSAQETLRAALHTVIKVPAVRGFKVELNGVLLSNALLTYRQLAVKCAQHYSWYAMRAIYIARGSSLLPPGFASLFDDSAASSLDVFFDPANGSVDVQGLTLGMFNILSKGLRKKGGGTSRLLGDVEHTVKVAGSNILFAVVTEVSDSVLKGAETSGLDGLLSGFRRGILNVAMRPAVLRSAVVQGGSTRRIKLDRNAGMDEVYIEGYLQAMLDSMYRQDYLKVKVTDEEVLLRNLPPNTALMEEIMSSVKKFLIGEGLLVGESSLAAARPTRRLQGDNERRLGPAMIALCEQLLVVISVQGLRRHATKILHLPRWMRSPEEEKEAANKKEVVPAEPEEPQEKTLTRVKHAASNFVLSSALAYLDGRLCRHIPNTLVRRIVSGFLLSFVE